MALTILKNPSADEIAAIIRGSAHKAARRLTDPRTGDVYVWDAAEGAHRHGAAQLGIPYDPPLGGGEILTL